jgi:hypothetical protein
LPEESDFVAAAREAIPAARVTTTQTREGLTGRGRGRATSAGAGRGTVIGEGRGNGSKKRSHQAGPSTAPTASKPATGRGNRAKRKSRDDHRQTELPDLNEIIPENDAEVIQVTQNAPE